MRTATALSSVVCGLVLGAGTASATPALPRPLERIIEDADLVVVAKLTKKPAHPRDAFTADVKETLKGRAPSGTLTAKAADVFEGCIPPPLGESRPSPASIEGRGDRVVLFLGADGESRDPIVLAAGEVAIPWIVGDRPASEAPDAVRALVALDAEKDDALAATLWTKGLAEGNALTVACLLHRMIFAARSPEETTASLGVRVAAAARAQFALGKEKLIADATRLAASADVELRRAAIRAAFACLYAGAVAPGPAFDALRDVCRAASRADDLGVRDDAVLCLAQARDPELPDRLLAAMKKRPLEAKDVRVGAVGRMLLFTAYPDRERDFLAAAVAMLDDPAIEHVGVETLEMLTGQCIGDADMWRAWWKKREAK
jgi:hypothetical protein